MAEKTSVVPEWKGLERRLTVQEGDSPVELNIKELLTKNRELYYKKNNDYGNAFMITFEKYGVVSFLVRLTDKFTRIQTLMAGETKYYADNMLYLVVPETEQQVLDESVLDSMSDSINYIIMMLMCTTGLDYDRVLMKILIDRKLGMTNGREAYPDNINIILNPDRCDSIMDAFRYYDDMYINEMFEFGIMLIEPMLIFIGNNIGKNQEDGEDE